jgi:hypothetical protein
MYPFLFQIGFLAHDTSPRPPLVLGKNAKIFPPLTQPTRSTFTPVLTVEGSHAYRKPFNLCGACAPSFFPPSPTSSARRRTSQKFQLPSVTPISSVTVSGRCVLVVFAFVPKTGPSPIRLFDWEFESVKFYCFISPP